MNLHYVTTLTRYCRNLVTNQDTSKEVAVLEQINNQFEISEKKNHFYINPASDSIDTDDIDKLINNQNQLITALQTYSNVNVLDLSVSRFETLLKEISKKVDENKN